MIGSGPPTSAPNSKFAHTIALLPELGKISRKQIAALVGLAPYDFDSGTNGQNRSLPCGEGLGVELQPIDARDVGEFERVLADFAGAPNGGLIVPLSTSAETHRTRIIALADRHRLPAVYHSRVDAALGGLISYGPDTVDLYRRAAGYVDRILKGEKPADLPVQAPTKYQLVINNKAVKALGLTIPSTLIVRADEVIE